MKCEKKVMKDEKKVVKARPLKGGVYYEVTDMNIHIFEYPGNFTLRSEEKSKQEVAVFDGGIFIEALQPGESISRNFEYSVRIEGTVGDDSIVAYIHLEW